MSRNSLKNVIRLIDTQQAEMPIEQSFLMDLKRSVEISDEKNFRMPSKSYKPSSMKCLRNMWYQVTGKEPDKGSSSYCLVGICNSGTDIHVRVQTAVAEMKKNGMGCEYVDVEKYVKSRKLEHIEIVRHSGMETKLYNKALNISFMCDGIIKYDNKYYILELKTESTYKWQNRTYVDESHYTQGIAYSMGLGIDDVIFVYINRDILDMKSYLFHVTEDMKQGLMSKIAECDSYVKKLKCPPKPKDISKKTCSYCNYRNSCQGN